MLKPCLVEGVGREALQTHRTQLRSVGTGVVASMGAGIDEAAQLDISQANLPVLLSQTPPCMLKTNLVPANNLFLLDLLLRSSLGPRTPCRS